MDKTNLPKTVQAVYQTLEKVKNNPNEWLTDVAGQLVFVAGGGLPLTFGSPDSKIWEVIEDIASENNGFVQVAGIDFSLRELALIGDFYRSMRGNGYSLHCIDERLKDDLRSIDKQVHEHCGACAAIHEVIGKKLIGKNVEDLLLAELGEITVGKQNIYASMPEHESMSIFIDFHGDEAVTDERKRAQLKNNKALIFQVSLPVKAIAEFLKVRGEDQELLLMSLVKWNLQLARNIIGGNHNKLQKYSQQTIFIFDQRDVEDNELINQFKQYISDIDHKRELVIE